VDAAARMLKVDVTAAEAGVATALGAGTLVLFQPAGVAMPLIYTSGAHRSEVAVADHLRRLRDSDGRLTHLVKDLEVDPELTEGQGEAVRRAFASPVSVLTGGPGTGKTRTVLEIVRVAQEADANVALCAPTGRAAKRMEEVTGHGATTIHRLLEARPMEGGGFIFARNEDDPLPHDLIVADEASMCDTRLAASLLRAVDDGAHLVLVGDPDQLPSVGSGDVLRDILVSHAVPHTALIEVHRQAAGSRIVTLAQEVNCGTIGPVAAADGDVFLAQDTNPTRMLARVVNAVADRAESHLGVKPQDVQVLAPMYRGPVGVNALNTALKERLNPAGSRKDVGGFHEGDRVMQTRNDPDRELSNGDIGRVADANLKKGILSVHFPSGAVEVDRQQARDLVLAWCVTVHKSQGGEWPVVVLVCDRTHGVMLWRNLVYTAITRAQKALIIVGQAEALRRAARQDGPRNRITGLQARLAES
jgi:exodeoxyribonuclease V alpha subunit